MLSPLGRCFSSDGRGCIEPPRYLLGAGRRCCWRPAPLLVAVPLPACKAAFLKIPPAMSSAGARSGHGDVTAKERRMGASLGDQAEIIPASVGESLQRAGHEQGTCCLHRLPGVPAAPQTVQQQVGIPWDPQCLSQIALQYRERELVPGQQRAGRVTPLLDPWRACSCCAGLPESHAIPAKNSPAAGRGGFCNAHR